MLEGSNVANRVFLQSLLHERYGSQASYCSLVLSWPAISQFHNVVQLRKVKHSGAPLDNHTWFINSWPQQKLPKFGFGSQTTALWPMYQSCILYAKFDCLVSYRNCSLLATAHDCETGV